MRFACLLQPGVDEKSSDLGRADGSILVNRSGFGNSKSGRVRVTEDKVIWEWIFRISQQYNTVHHACNSCDLTAPSTQDLTCCNHHEDASPQSK